MPLLTTMCSPGLVSPFRSMTAPPYMAALGSCIGTRLPDRIQMVFRQVLPTSTRSMVERHLQGRILRIHFRQLFSPRGLRWDISPPSVRRHFLSIRTIEYLSSKRFLLACNPAS